MTDFPEMAGTQRLVELLEEEIASAGASILEQEQGNRHGSWQYQCMVGEHNNLHRYITLSLLPAKGAGPQSFTLQVNIGAEHEEGFLNEPVDTLPDVDLGQPELEDRAELWMEAVVPQALRKVENLELNDLTSTRESFSERAR